MSDIFEHAEKSVSGLSEKMIAQLRTSLAENMEITPPRVPGNTAENRRKKSNSRILLLLGIISMISGGAAMIYEEGWGKWALFSGIGCVGVDLFLSHKKKSVKSSSGNVSVKTYTIPMARRYEVIRKLSEIAERICSDWKIQLNSTKETLRKAISDSDASENQKVKANYTLNVVNTISFSMDEWIPRFESADTPQSVRELIAEFGAYFTGRIEEACNKQCLAYTAAGNILKNQR